MPLVLLSLLERVRRRGRARSRGQRARRLEGRHEVMGGVGELEVVTIGEEGVDPAPSRFSLTRGRSSAAPAAAFASMSATGRRAGLLLGVSLSARRCGGRRVHRGGAGLLAPAAKSSRATGSSAARASSQRIAGPTGRRANMWPAPIVGEEAQRGPTGLAKNSRGVLAREAKLTSGSFLPWMIASGTARCACQRPRR